MSQPSSTSRRAPCVLLLDEHGHHSQKVAVCLGQINGLKLHVVSNQRWVPVRFSRHARSFQSYSASAANDEKLGVIVRAIKQTGSEILLPVVEGGVQFIQNNRKVLEPLIALPPCPALQMMDLVINKDSLCHFLEENHLPLPATVYLNSANPSDAELGKLRFPLLFKPADSGGGTGIQSFGDRESFLAFLNGRRTKPRSIVQSFVAGYDVDCSVLCQNGVVLAHTIQKSFLPRQNKYGSDEAIEFIDHPQTLAVVEQLMRALNWSGIAHLDLRYDEEDGQVKVLDFNPRYWTSLLGSLAAGVNFPDLSCQSALGIEFNRPTARKGKFFTAEAAIKQIFRRCAGKKGVKLKAGESGLPYAFNDPNPRVFAAVKNLVSILKPKRLP